MRPFAIFIFLVLIGQASAQLNTNTDGVTSTTSLNSFPGDFDGNFDVNVADFLAFVEVFGTTYSLSPHATDRDVLVALYYATNGANWRNKTNWLTDNDLSTWYGVRTSNNKVTSLNLEQNNLTGIIPAALGGLSDINTLMLAWNQLSGSIPSELGNLSILRKLWIGTNKLSGAIPSELGNLVNLTHLNLDKNQLSGRVPSELDNLTY